MQFSYKVPYCGGTQYLYAIGERNAVIQAARFTFSNHGRKIHSEKDQIFLHYASSWVDRATTTYGNFSGSGHHSDKYVVEYLATDIPTVTRLRVYIFHKTSLFNKKKIASSVERFYHDLLYEFGMLNIHLISNHDWRDFTSKYPDYNCSLRWKDEFDD